MAADDGAGQPPLASLNASRRRRRRSSGESSLSSLVEVPIGEESMEGLDFEDWHMSAHHPDDVDKQGAQQAQQPEASPHGDEPHSAVERRLTVTELQNTTAECCVESVVESFLAGATVAFAIIVFLGVSLDLTEQVTIWQVFSCLETVFLGVFVIECSLRVFAFGRSYVRVASNISEVGLSAAALGFEGAVCARLFRRPPALEVDAVVVLGNLCALGVVVFRLRRFQDVLNNVGALLKRQRARSEAVHAPDRVLELLRRIRRKYPLTVKEAQEVNWASFLIASRKLYSGVGDDPTTQSASLFEGLDEETTNWLLNTYSNVQVQSTAGSAGAVPASAPPQTPRAHAQSADMGTVDAERICTGALATSSTSDSALIRHASANADLESEAASLEFNGRSLELQPISGTSPPGSLQGSPRSPSAIGAVVAGVPLVDGPPRVDAPAAQRKGLASNGRAFASRSSRSQGVFETLGVEENAAEDVHVGDVDGLGPEPPNTVVGRLTSGSAVGVVLEDLENIRNALLLHSEIPATRREMAEQLTPSPASADPAEHGAGGVPLLVAVPPTSGDLRRRQNRFGRGSDPLREPLSAAAALGSGRNSNLEEFGSRGRGIDTGPFDEAGEDDGEEGQSFGEGIDEPDFDALHASPSSSGKWSPLGHAAPIGVGNTAAGARRALSVRGGRHARTRTSLSSQGGPGGNSPTVKIRVLAEHARLGNLKWTQAGLDNINATLDEWSFDVFEASEFSGGRPLSMVLLGTLRKNGVYEEFPNLRRDTMLSFITAVENGYRVDNPYHNRIHAADVVQTTHYFLTHEMLRSVITAHDIFASLVAAAIHDFQHPGTSNSFLVATGDKLALRYNDRAVLEHMHVAAAFELMRTKHCDVLRCVGDAEKYHEVRETVIQMVLATDMSNHFEGLERFKTEVVQYFESVRQRRKASGMPASAAAGSIESVSSLNLGSAASSAAAGGAGGASGASSGDGLPMLLPPIGAENELPPLPVRRTLLKTSLHCADVSNPAKKPKLCQNWAMLVQEEFFRQGDREREAGLKISMFMDRNKPAFHKCQIGFITIIVKPLFASYCQFLTTLKPQVDWCLNANASHWERKQEEEEASHAIGNAVPLAPIASGRRTSFRFVPERFKSSLVRSQSTAFAMQPPSSPRVSRQGRRSYGSGGIGLDAAALSALHVKAAPALQRSQTDHAINTHEYPDTT